MSDPAEPFILTASSVRALRPASRIEIRDTVVPGLILRASPTAKVWSVVGGRRRRLRVTIGRYPRWGLADARDEARRILRALDRGEIPSRRHLADAARTVTSLAAACLWSRRRALRRSTMAEWLRLCRREIVPQWGTREPASIERQELRAWLERLASRAPYTANRAGEVLRRLYSWGVEHELLAANPLLGMRLPHRERPRQRVLTLAEARAVWRAAGQEGRLGPAARLSLLTAARRREVLGMRWDELQLDPAATWTVEGARRKGGQLLILPLVPAARTILRAIRRAQRRRPGGPSEWVFPAHGTPGPAMWASALVARLRARTGVAFRLHDLRRTLASHLSAHGISDDVIKAILGHRRPRLTHTYQVYAPLQPMREALEWWAEHIAGGPAPKESQGRARPSPIGPRRRPAQDS